MGDANLDYRDRFGTGRPNFVPTFIFDAADVGETASDAWFVQLAGDDPIPELAIGQLTNADRLPFVATANCLNGFFVHPFTDATIAEALLRKPDGGAVAVWSSSSLGTAILFGDPALRLRLAPAARQHLPLVKR